MCFCSSKQLLQHFDSMVIDRVCMILLLQLPDITPDPLVPSTLLMLMGLQVKDEYTLLSSVQSSWIFFFTHPLGYPHSSVVKSVIYINFCSVVLIIQIDMFVLLDFVSILMPQ